MGRLETHCEVMGCITFLSTLPAGLCKHAAPTKTDLQGSHHSEDNLDLCLLFTCRVASLNTAAARAGAQPHRCTAASSPGIINLQNPGMVVEGAWQLIPGGVSNAISHGRIIPFSPLQINDSHQSLHDCLKKRSGSSRKG